MSDYRHNPEYLRQRRAIIRRFHPDLGGSDEQLIKALRELDAQWDRRLKLRAQLEQHRPGFIPKDVADQAIQRADQAMAQADRMRSRFEKVVGGSDRQSRNQTGNARSAAENAMRKIRREVASNGIVETVARNAGRAAGQVQKRLRKK
ncbi:hypothetical protein [uncultured Corynebacterium sp.]|uniref:hypothetical protein n=1 Tax=uncultured Corynebacterium sp. TaxID=159447 RepID=UPI0025FC5B97|nr:hypothetical protein [uncultured Corynebacterium sp.]